MNVIDRYLDDAETWDQEIYANIQISRNRAWLVSFFCMGVTFLSLLTLVLLLPLKTFAPYVVTVNKNTGYVEVTKGLYKSKITADDAVTESNLVRYVSARECYNPSTLRQSYGFVALMSSGTALDTYRQLWDGKNPDNPSVRLGTEANIDVRIESVSFLNSQTAEVHFQKVLKQNGQTRTSGWDAIIDFRYVNAPMKMEDRFRNPLGFQVTSYSINPETMETAQ